MSQATVGPDASSTESRASLSPRPAAQSPDRQPPSDLYIPPDALEVFLDAFEGPLDLLLYLIRKQDIDILDIPVLQVTRQYMQYVEIMQQIKLDLASEYLVMAAWLAAIKSRVLLPKAPLFEDEEPCDPKAELIRRLQEYERFKLAAEQLEAQPRVGRDFYLARAGADLFIRKPVAPAPDIRELLKAFHDVLVRVDFGAEHMIRREPLSVRERMSHLIDRLQSGSATLDEVIEPSEGRAGVVVVLLAVLELVKMTVLDVVQPDVFGIMTLALRPVETGEPRDEHGN